MKRVVVVPSGTEDTSYVKVVGVSEKKETLFIAAIRAMSNSVDGVGTCLVMGGDGETDVKAVWDACGPSICAEGLGVSVDAGGEGSDLVKGAMTYIWEKIANNLNDTLNVPDDDTKRWVEKCVNDMVEAFNHMLTSYSS